MKLIQYMLDAVQAAPARVNAYEEFLDSAYGVLALALSMVPVERRERVLQDIEDGRLRHEVSKFPGTPTVPEVDCGTLH